jgi:hypothetical protein
VFALRYDEIHEDDHDDVTCVPEIISQSDDS